MFVIIEWQMSNIIRQIILQPSSIQLISAFID
jgi:hypothetical protein